MLYVHLAALGLSLALVHTTLWHCPPLVLALCWQRHKWELTLGIERVQSGWRGGAIFLFTCPHREMCWSCGKRFYQVIGRIICRSWGRRRETVSDMKSAFLAAAAASCCIVMKDASLMNMHRLDNKWINHFKKKSLAFLFATLSALLNSSRKPLLDLTVVTFFFFSSCYPMFLFVLEGGRNIQVSESWISSWAFFNNVISSFNSRKVWRRSRGYWTPRRSACISSQRWWTVAACTWWAGREGGGGRDTYKGGQWCPSTSDEKRPGDGFVVTSFAVQLSCVTK